MNYAIVFSDFFHLNLYVVLVNVIREGVFMERLNIYHRKDGRWEGRISRGKKENGKRKFLYIFGKSKEQVCKKMKEIRMSETSDHCCKTVQEVFDEWICSAKHRVKESTLSNYKLKGNKHILPIFGSLRISDVSSEEIYSFIEKKQDSGLSNRYILDILIVMKSTFKYAVRTYHICNPMDGIIIPKKRNREIRILESHEQQQLEKYISENRNNTTMGVALTMNTGIRIGELCALQWGDIDLEKRILTVKKTIQRIQSPNGDSITMLIISDPKSESSKRSIPLTQKMIEFLTAFKGESDEFILSGSEKPIEPRTMQYRFAKILKNVNLPSVHFHALRHMFASTCIKIGFDVKPLSELLGHSKVEITLNRYVHSSFEQKREYMERLNFDF